MNKTITLLVADDHPIYRDGLRQMIGSDPGLKIIHETGDGVDGLAQARILKPDVVLLDLDMPGLNGLDFIRARRREQLPFKIVILTMHKGRDMFEEAINLGAEGYVLKESAAADILKCIHSVARGESYVSPGMLGPLLELTKRNAGVQLKQPGVASLTPAQRRILKLIASDKTSKEIAELLGISYRTVENHRANIATRLGLQGSHSLLKFAFENKADLLA